MIKQIVTDQELRAFATFFDGKRDIVLTCHMSPDGDALGSCLGLAAVLRQRGKRVNIVTPDMPPATLSILPGYAGIAIATQKPERANVLLRHADGIVALDFNEPHRIDRLANAYTRAKSPKLNIDHHLGDCRLADITIRYPDMSSTCELLFRLLYHAGWYDDITSEAATCIYCGMMTDTGNFSYNSNRPDLYAIVYHLMLKGIDKDGIYDHVLNAATESSLRIKGYALADKMTLYPDCQAALLVLTSDELKARGFRKGDTEGLVNMPLRIPGIRWSTFVRQDPEYIKVSMRSTGDFAVNGLCQEYFNGGGHLNAAGGEARGSSLDEVIATYLSILDKIRNDESNRTTEI